MLTYLSCGLAFVLVSMFRPRVIDILRHNPYAINDQLLVAINVIGVAIVTLAWPLLVLQLVLSWMRGNRKCGG